MPSTKTAMFPLASKADGPGSVVPDAWPTDADLKWVSEKGRAAVDAVGQLSLVLSRRLRAFVEANESPEQLTASEFGSLILLLDSLKQDGATLLSDAEKLAQELDDVKWEAVDSDAF